MSFDAKTKQKLEKLVQKAMEGDSSAFGQIYDLYFEKVYRFLYYRVNHRETAEDLLAETFIKAWQKIPDMQNALAFQSWVYKIARNLVIDHYRTKKETADLSELENVLEYEDNVIDELHLEYEQKILFQHVKKLTGDQQIVIKLKFIDDLENSEIAEILDKTEGAIRVIQHRAITELKKLANQANED